jgi:hypothetical protein
MLVNMHKEGDVECYLVVPEGGAIGLEGLMKSYYTA